MATLSPGSKAPDFKLKGLDGKVHSPSGLKEGQLAVLAFYKETCPVCAFAFPFLDRIFKHHANDEGVRFFAVAQEDERAARDFGKNLKLSMPQALDPSPYKISDQYGLTNVPTVVVVSHDGRVRKSIVGFVKKDYEELAGILAEATGKDPVAVFAGVDVPEVRPG